MKEVIISWIIYDGLTYVEVHITVLTFTLKQDIKVKVEQKTKPNKQFLSDNWYKQETLLNKAYGSIKK